MNQAIQISLDELGRILVPALVRERLHLSPGMTLVVEKGEHGDVHLCIEPEPTTLVETGLWPFEEFASSDANPAHKLRHLRMPPPQDIVAVALMAKVQLRRTAY
jgi:AbrB family looped-hinge helix DNA binding protein